MKEAFDIEQGTVNYLNTTYAVILFFVFNIFRDAGYFLVSDS